MKNIFLKQVPLTRKIKFTHPHKCCKCKRWQIYGIMTYFEDTEESVFICKNCKPPVDPFSLPQKTKFRNPHECKECKTVGKVGLLTYCTRCESVEFVCFGCIENWSSSAMPENKDKQFFAFEDYEITVEEEIKILMEQPYADP